VLVIREVELDFETRSELDIKRAGAQAYARHPTTEVLCLAYSFDGAEPKLWTPDLPRPQDLFDAIAGGAKMKAHNASFERAVWRWIMMARYAWPVVPFDQWRCTQAACAHRAVPLALENASTVLRVVQHKGDADKRVFKPRKPTVKERKAWAAAHGDAPMPTLWHEDFDLMQKTYDYCAQDVRAEHEVGTVVGELPPGELAVWRLDQIVNDRGVQIDVPNVEKAVALVGRLEEKNSAELEKITGGIRGTQRDKFKAWLAGHGVDFPDMTSDTIDLWLKTAPEGFVRRAVELRQALTKAGTKKLQAMLDCVCPDGRARGLVQYHGATTGRFAGRLVQPQNFKRPTWADAEDMDVDALVEAISLASDTGDVDFLTMVYGDPVEAVSHALRSYLVAAPGRVLVAGDFKAIEAVGTAAISGCESKLDVFRAKKDPYLVFASAVFGIDVQKKDKPKRTVGKMGELSFGYGGSVGAWRNFEPAGPSVHTDEDILKYRDIWREAHPEIVAGWHGLEAAAIGAVTAKPSGWREIEYFMADDGDWLGCRLPSGRCMWYREPRVVEAQMPWTGKDGRAIFRPQFQYKAWKPDQGGWVTVRAWGGHLMENVVQGACRDLMVAAMFRAEKANFPVVLTVHDELVTEVDARRPDADWRVLADIMRERPAWASNWPIDVDGFHGYRYRK
jgi:DNA polymerase